MSESALVRGVLELCRALGVWAWRANAGAQLIDVPGTRRRLIRLGEAGTPDVLLVLPGGRLCGLECKAPGGKLRASQERWHERASREGVRVAVVRSVRDAQLWVVRWRAE